MAPRIVWTIKARKDVERLAEYIAQDSPRNAQSVVTKITQATRNLAAFPRMGRIVPELNDEKIRELIVFSFRVIYRIRARRITIWAVIHGARHLENAVRNRKR